MTAPEFRAWRQALGWSQAEAAEALGVSSRTIKHWEAGTRKPSEPTVRLIKLLAA